MYRSGTPSYPVHSDYTQVTGVVAAEPAGQFFRVFTRNAQGVTFHDYPFSPFFLLSDPGLTDAAPVMVTHHRLAGNGRLCWLTVLGSWHDWCLLREYLQTLNRPEAWFALQDGCQQFLVTSGITFFKGLAFKDHRHICIALQKDADALHTIAVTDGLDYRELICSSHQTEAAMLLRLTQIIQDYDPDVITGYHLNTSVLPNLVQSAQQHKITLAWGRNGSAPYRHQTADLQAQQQYTIYGRSAVDSETMMRPPHRLAQTQSAPVLEPEATLLYSFEQASADDRSVIAAAGQASTLYQQRAEQRYRHAQTYPVSYQSSFYRPEAAAAQALMLHEYLLQRHALPALPAAQKQHRHPDEQLLFQGQAGPVIRCDLSRLPASIMVAYRITPFSDELRLFPELLKKSAQHSKTGHSNDSSPGVTAWHEMLATPRYLFSDITASTEIERLRQVIIKDLLAWLTEIAARPLVVNSQELYFVPPCGHEDGSEEVNMLLQRLSNMLPSGVSLPYAGPYPSMFMYKANQYAVLNATGEVFFKGAIFRSRSMEPFLQEFVRETARLLLTERGAAVEQLHADFMRRLAAATCPVAWVARNETLADPREQYLQAVKNGARNRAAVYELALREKGNWQIGEKISYYVTGASKNCVVHANCKLAKDFDPQHPDLNKAWYLERLHQLFKRLIPIPTQGALFVGSSSAPQRTACTPSSPQSSPP